MPFYAEQQVEQPKARKSGKAEVSLPPVELLKRFHTARSKDEVAEEHAESLTEHFFQTADAMLKMVGEPPTCIA